MVRLAAVLTQSPVGAEDIAEEAFVRLYPRWATTLNPGGYVRTSLVNICRNRWRHARVHNAKLPLLLGPDTVEPETADLAAVVAALAYRQRAVIVLRYYLGWSETQIADALSVRPGTVKSLAARALARLAKEITE